MTMICIALASILWHGFKLWKWVWQVSTKCYCSREIHCL